MNRRLIAVFLLAPLAPAWGQQSLSSQVEAVFSVQQHQEQAIRQAQSDQEEQQRRAQQEEAYAERLRAAASARAAQARYAEAKTEQQAKAADAKADKDRDQAYQDQLRSLDLQERSLQLQVEKARVARANEYIDRDLQKQAAENDVIKSQADTARDVSAGEKALMEKTGDAEIKKQSGLFH